MTVRVDVQPGMTKRALQLAGRQALRDLLDRSAEYRSEESEESDEPIDAGYVYRDLYMLGERYHN